MLVSVPGFAVLTCLERVPFDISGIAAVRAGQWGACSRVADSLSDLRKNVPRDFPVFVNRSDFPCEGHHQRSAGKVNDKDSES